MITLWLAYCVPEGIKWNVWRHHGAGMEIPQGRLCLCISVYGSLSISQFQTSRSRTFSCGGRTRGSASGSSEATSQESLWVSLLQSFSISRLKSLQFAFQFPHFSPYISKEMDKLTRLCSLNDEKDAIFPALVGAAAIGFSFDSLNTTVLIFPLCTFPCLCIGIQQFHICDCFSLIWPM